MCGLVGIAGNIFGKPKDMFTELLIIDSLRGMHSTGMAVVARHDSAFKVVKRPGPSQFLIADPEYKSALQYSAKCVIGHNRYATLGAHTTENAHPFEFSHTVGAHNGTLDKWSTKQLHNSNLFDTDSEAIFSNINEYGIEETVKHLSGAWALVWFDKTDNSLNFLRNEKRPLFYCYSEDRGAIMWASEVEMLEFTLARNNCKYEGLQFFTVDKDTHIKWIVPQNATDKFDPPFKTPMAAPKHQIWSYGGHNHHQTAAYGSCGYWEAEMENWEAWDNKLETEKPQDKTHDVVITVIPPKADGQNVLPFTLGKASQAKPPSTGKSRVDTKRFRPPYKIQERAIKKADFHAIVSNGCVGCSDNGSQWGEFIQILPEKVNGTNLFLCQNCYNNEEYASVFEYAL